MFNPSGINSAIKPKSLIEIDDDFFHHSSHTDGALIAKIESGKFVELEKLLPKEKIIHSDGTLQMIYRDGAQFLQPVSEKDTRPINSLRRWEQAFEIYATIYTMKKPERAAELFKYMFNIRSASAVYVWDNVYAYDVTFRRMMEKNPDRNWGVIYQQGWTLLLREKQDRTNNNNFNSSFNKKRGGARRRTRHAGISTKENAIMGQGVILSTSVPDVPRLTTVIITAPTRKITDQGPPHQVLIREAKIMHQPVYLF